MQENASCFPLVVSMLFRLLCFSLPREYTTGYVQDVHATSLHATCSYAQCRFCPDRRRRKRKKKTYRASPGRVTIATIVGATWEHVADAGGAGVAGILAVREAPSDPCGKRLGFESFPLHGPEPVLTNDRSSLDGMRIPLLLKSSGHFLLTQRGNGGGGGSGGGATTDDVSCSSVVSSSVLTVAAVGWFLPVAAAEPATASASASARRQGGATAANGSERYSCGGNRSAGPRQPPAALSSPKMFSAVGGAARATATSASARSIASGDCSVPRCWVPRADSEAGCRQQPPGRRAGQRACCWPRAGWHCQSTRRTTSGPAAALCTHCAAGPGPRACTAEAARARPLPI